MTVDKNQRSRLLLVGPYPPPFGGIASHLTSLVPGLKTKGWEDIAIVSFGAVTAEESITGATVYRYNVKEHASQLLNPSNWRFLFASLICFANARLGGNGLIKEAAKTMLVCRIAKKHRSEVVSIYQADLSLMLLPCARLWKSSKKIVLTVFGEIYDNYKFIKERKDLFDRLLQVPAHVLASSKHCASSFTKLGINREITPVYYGIELERFQTPLEKRMEFRKQLGVSPDDVLVFYMGRFNEEMGLQNVLDAARTILAKKTGDTNNIKFLLAGAKGPLSEMANKMSSDYPGFISVIHDVPFAQQPAMYAGSDIVLAPSRDQHACMGMSIKEAMAAGRPVIGSISGGIPEAIIHEENGLLIPLDDSNSIDPQEFEASILRLAKDETTRNRFGQAGRKRAEDVFAATGTINKMDHYLQLS